MAAKIRRPALTAIAAATAVLALLARFRAAGWLSIPGAVIYPAIAIGHVLIHFKASGSAERNRLLRPLVLSNLLLLVAFLLQVDYGDGPCAWLTLMALLPGPGYAPCISLEVGYGALLDVFLFVPVVITWAWLLPRRKRSMVL